MSNNSYPRTEYTLPKNKVSFSSLRSFLDCPECWYRSRILGESGRMGISLPIGNAIHEGLAEARRIAAGFKGEGDPLQVAAEQLDVEIGKIEPGLLDFESTAATPDEAKDLVVRLVKRGIEILLPEEERRGIVAVESRPEYGHLFPFTIDGYIDVIIGGPVLLFKDLKSARDGREPDGFYKAQLRLYTLPWHLAGQEVQMQIDTLPKTGKTAWIPTAVETTGDGYESVREWVLKTAGQISDAMKSGDFPAHPGRFCDYPHPMAA